MSHVIVVYAGPLSDRDVFGRPTGFYFGTSGRPLYTSPHDAERGARDASLVHGLNGYNTARYAVHRWLGDASGPQTCDIPDASLLSSPVYVPPGSEDCAAHFINASVAVYPIDPSLPLELEDDTPCRLLDIGSDRIPRVRITPLREPTGPYAARWNGSYGWWHDLSDGAWSGEPSYLRLRNVLPHSNAIAAPPMVASVIPAAVMASTKPLPLAETKAAAGETPPTFEIRAGLTGTDRETWGTVAEGFASGKEAATWVSTRKAEYASAGKSLHIVKREAPAVAIDWRARERDRFESGAYVPLPGQWADLVAKAYPDHFAHVATSDKRKVAFTETEASGERDKQKVLSAAEYASRYFDSYERGHGFGSGGYRYWTHDRREEFIAEMCGASTQVLFAPLGDEEAMDRVYADCHQSRYEGIASCMTHGGKSYANNERPVRVYALGGDITIAFLRGYATDTDEEDGSSLYGLADPDATWDGEGSIIARCLVWPEAKQFARVYGDSTSACTLRSALEAQGYRSGDLYGARLGKVPLPEHGAKAYQMPYLDIGGGNFDHSECGEYFVVGGDMSGGATNGVCYAHEKETCDHCDRSVNTDQVEDVLISEDDHERWCRNCRDDGAYYVDYAGTHAYVSHDHTVQYVPEGRFDWQARWIADWQLVANGGSLPGTELDGLWMADGFRCVDCGAAMVGRHRSEIPEVCLDCHEAREESSNTSDDDTAIAA